MVDGLLDNFPSTWNLQVYLLHQSSSNYIWEEAVFYIFMQKVGMQKSESKKYELNDMTQKCLLRLKHQVQIRILKQTDEECIIVFLDILSANIVDNIIDADIYHEAFAYFVDEV